jgi:hypothetical protein
MQLRHQKKIVLKGPIPRNDNEITSALYEIREEALQVPIITYRIYPSPMIYRS